MQNPAVVTGISGSDLEMTNLKIVVRKTFLDIEDDFEPGVFRSKGLRERSYSDTIVGYAEADSDSEQSTAEGDSIPSGSMTPCSMSDQSSSSIEPLQLEAALEFSARAPAVAEIAPAVQMWVQVQPRWCLAGFIQAGPPAVPVGPSVSSSPPGHWQSPVQRWPCQEFEVAEPSSKAVTRTTLMLRNLPSCFTKQALLDTLDSKGMAGQFDFVYLPIDFLSGAALGYAFVNFSTTEDAELAMDRLQGFNSWNNLLGSASQKVLEVCWSDPHQGLDMLVERYRNSRVMHGSVPDEFKPVMFKDGEKIDFPRPTKRVRPPFSGGVVVKSAGN